MRFSGCLKKVLFALKLLCFHAVKAQIFYPILCSEKELLVSIEQANTPAEQVDAAGLLAQHYKSKFEDSLSSIYLYRLYRVVELANDPKLLARAMWWEAHISAGITAYDETKQADAKANKLLQFAAHEGFYLEIIAANLLLADIHVHKNLRLTELHSIAAKKALNEWAAGSSEKDSMKLEVNYRLSHVFIHKKEGEKAAQCLLEQQKYAEQKENEALKIQAVNNLAQLYLEWPEQEDNARQWIETLYYYYKKTGQKNKLFVAAYLLADAYLRINDKEAAIKFLHEADQLQSSLKIYTPYLYWLALEKRSLDIITDKELLNLLDTRFNNHLSLPLALVDLHKAAVYMKTGQLDSAEYYFTKAEKDKMDSLGSHFSFYDNLPAQFYLKKKEYITAIKAFDDLKRKAEEQGNRGKFLEALQGLSKAYEGKADYKTANTILKRYYEVKDSLDKLNYNAKVAYLEVQKEKAQTQNERELHQQLIYRYWLYSLIGLIGLLLTGTYFFYQYRLKQLQLKGRLAKEKSGKLLAEKEYQYKLNEIQLAALRSQMNPHFIFNVLNTLQSFIYADDKKAAAFYLGKFSELMRKTLDYSRRQTITLEEELEIIRLYLTIEKARFDDHLTIKLSVDETLQLSDILLPPLFVQPYIENAFKHGLLHLQGDKKLLIDVCLSEKMDAVIIRIDDNGIGRKQSAAINKSRLNHHSFASEANEKRAGLMNELWGQKIDVQIEDKISPEGFSEGTTVFIRIPVENTTLMSNPEIVKYGQL